MNDAAVPPRPPAATLSGALAVIRDLAAAGLAPCLFGGWAKELHGVWRGGGHHDVDLLVVADSMAELDRFLAGRREFPGKRHPHKRAWWEGETLVEMIRVRPAPDGLTTDFYGQFVRPWQDPLSTSLRAPDGTLVAVATAGNIIAYERDHRRIQDAFFAAYPAIREEAVRRYQDPYMPYSNYFVAP